MRGSIYAWCFQTLAALALAGCVTPAGGTWPREGVASISGASSPAAVAPGSGLQLEVTPFKPTVELGEPVYLALRLTNTGSEPRTVAGYLPPGEGLLDVFIEAPGGKLVEFSPRGESDFGEAARIVLEPGESAGDVAPIFFGGDGWTFTEAGSYRISATLLVPDKDGGFTAFRSEPASLDVVEAEAGRSLLATDPKTLIEAGKFLLWRSGDHLEAGQAALASIAEAHPRSALAAYVQSAFARSFSESFADYRLGAVRPPDCARAATHRAAVATARLPANLQIEDDIAMTRCHALEGTLRGALRHLSAAAKLADGRPELAPLAARVAETREHLRKAPQ